nr:MAG TPA: hypothetical protein [Caudoviricetes sp.]
MTTHIIRYAFNARSTRNLDNASPAFSAFSRIIFSSDGWQET